MSTYCFAVAHVACAMASGGQTESVPPIKAAREERVAVRGFAPRIDHR